MPLIVITGYPSSGKTTRCKELTQYMMEAHGKSVEIVGQDVEYFNKNVVYADSATERNMRSHLKASVQRLLSPDCLVILDSLSYIKGFRYELYCSTKSANTTHCVMHCATSKEICSQWNDRRPETERYTPQIFDDLIMRYEQPNHETRWDRPLFVVHPADPLPGKEIWEALYERKAPPANLSTLSQPLSATNFLYDLDRITQSIVASLMESQKHSAGGESISIPMATEKLKLSRPLTLMELHRYRRQFISYTKTHPVSDARNLPNIFIQYLQGIVA